MHKKVLLNAIAVGIWVSIYSLLQEKVYGLFGLEHVEVWPALMAPGLIALLGGGRQGTKKFYCMMSAGMLAALVFILAEHAIVPHLGAFGKLTVLALIVAFIIAMGKVLPSWFGGVTFVAFNASLILVSDMLLLTVVRLAVLLVGATVFLLVEHVLSELINGHLHGRGAQHEDPPMTQAIPKNT